MALNRVSMILPGLASIIPTPIFYNIFTSSDLRLRVSGSPEINLALLKVRISITYLINIWEMLKNIILNKFI